MGLFSRIRETNKMATRKSRLIPPSSSTERHHPHATDRRPMNIPPVRSKHLDRPVYDESSPPHPPGPSTSFPSLAQNAIHVLPRVAKDLYREAFYHITPYIGTEYPCTTEDLNASGGIARQIPLGGNVQAKKALWFTGPNAGPFIDPAKASREIFDHNQPKRMPSAAEERAIQRLVTGLKNAGQKYWGPDLAVKAFCDLDKVFFRGRLRGHVCLTWRSDESFQHYCFGDTTLLKGGKCVIQLNAYAIFCGFEVVSGFTQMFATLLHEMWYAHWFYYRRSLPMLNARQPCLQGSSRAMLRSSSIDGARQRFRHNAPCRE